MTTSNDTHENQDAVPAPATDACSMQLSDAALAAPDSSSVRLS